MHTYHVHWPGLINEIILLPSCWPIIHICISRDRYYLSESVFKAVLLTEPRWILKLELGNIVILGQFTSVQMLSEK